MEPESINTYEIMGRGWVRLPGSPLEIRIDPWKPAGSIELRWNPEEDFFGALRRDADSSPA